MDIATTTTPLQQATHEKLQTMETATTTTPLQQAKDMSIGSEEATQTVDEPTDKIRKDVQAKSLANEVKFTTNNKLFAFTVRNYFPNLCKLHLMVLVYHK